MKHLKWTFSLCWLLGCIALQAKDYVLISEIMYDNYLYGARDYYAAIERFTVIDPLAYKTPHISPYAYCANNPIKYIDPDGREIYEFDSDGQFTGNVISQGGNLDFVNMSDSFLQNDANVLFLPIDGTNIAYNSFDFGNYLWGQSMQRLKIPLGLSRFAAHIDNLLHHWLQLDSPTDQQAIINGYNYHMIR